MSKVVNVEESANTGVIVSLIVDKAYDISLVSKVGVNDSLTLDTVTKVSSERLTLVNVCDMLASKVVLTLVGTRDVTM